MPLILSSNVTGFVWMPVWLDPKLLRMWMLLSLLVPCPERKEWRGDETLSFVHCFIEIILGRTFLPSMWRSSRCRDRLWTSLPRRPARFLWVKATLFLVLYTSWCGFYFRLSGTLQTQMHLFALIMRHPSQRFDWMTYTISQIIIRNCFSGKFLSQDEAWSEQSCWSDCREGNIFLFSLN